MRKLLAAAALFLCLTSGAQIVNRLNVDKDTFERYAWGRLQEYNSNNLILADSLYSEGIRQNNFRYKCLALSLEFPVRFAQGEYARMDSCIVEIKELIGDRKDLRTFYFPTLHEYCQYLVHIGRASDAVLEARAMERIASAEKKPLGKMYSYRIIGLIQSYRDNSHLAVRNFEKAVKFCRDAHADQDLPNLYILIAQECVKMKDFVEADNWCVQAEKYQAYFPSVGLKAQMTRAYLNYAKGNNDAFWQCYDALLDNHLYRLQTDADTRFDLDICYLRSKGLLEQALSKADSLGTARGRFEQKHGIYAELGSFDHAYDQLSGLMQQKDSIYIKVQNEDLAILDAEMNNAQLREDAQRLKARNQMTIMLGFIAMFAIAFFSLVFNQWQLRQNLEEMRKKNSQALAARRAFQRAMEAKESENDYRVKILQNRKTNPLTSYEDLFNL